jgi:hypothetical protein
MSLKDDYVSVRIADLLKENGFDEWCGTYYISGRFNYGTPIKNSYLTKGVVSAPTMSLAMKWLREKYNVFISIIRWGQEYCVDMCDKEGRSFVDKDHSVYFDTYYEAAETTLFNILADLHIWVGQSHVEEPGHCDILPEDEYYAKHIEECYDNNPIAYLAAIEMATHIRQESVEGIEEDVETTE